MPLLTFDLIEGRTEQEIRTLLDAAHRAVLRAFEVPERDRYQIAYRLAVNGARAGLYEHHAGRHPLFTFGGAHPA